MLHEITITFDTSDGTFNCAAKGQEKPEQVLNILETARKKLREELGLHEIIVQYSPETQTTTTSFDANQIKTWDHFSAILRSALDQGDFNSWFGKFVMANQAMAQQAHGQMQEAAIKAALAGRPNGRLPLR